MPKYQHPKILLVDMNEDAVKAIEACGYTASLASLGCPYKVKQENSFYPLSNWYDLPQDYKEQDIVVIDMCYNPNYTVAKDVIEKVEVGVDKWWVNHSRGHVNPRPFFSSLFRSDFDRILNMGGVFVIFANALEIQRYYFGHDNYYSPFESKQEEVCSNWEFLTITGYEAEYKIREDHGATITFSQELTKNSSIKLLLSEYLEEATYNCTLSLGSWFEKEWVSWLKNKYGNDVAGLLVPSEQRRGWVLILPDLKNKVTFTTKLIDQLLPGIVPSLFPEQEYSSWVNRFEYSLPQVKRLQEQIIEIREQTNLKIKELEQEIENNKNAHLYLFNLLTETGNALVETIKETFRVLGFKQIKDVDQELEDQGIQRQNREDLQIHDHETTLILEVKGISGFPSDDDVLAVQKYVVLRMREWQSINVQGLTIINHHKHLPPLDRDNNLPFRQEMLDASEEQKIGLLTTWDLHRLAKSFIQNKWKHEDIKDLFYQVGRVNILPNHYEFIGTIQRFIEKKGIVGIQIEASSLKFGDRIAFELPVVFEEQECESLEFESNPIEFAEIGMLIGTKTKLSKEDARIGVCVYKIIR